VILVAASVALFIRGFVIEAYRVPSDFMAPTLKQGELIFVNKLSYALGALPKAGEVVLFNLFSDPSKDFLKRVVALPGDKVSIQGCELFINSRSVSQKLNSTTDSPANFHWVESLDSATYGVKWQQCDELMPVTVPPGHVFVLGDNRGMGQDSRHWGFLPMSGLKGRAWLVWYSKESSRLLKRIQ
jgi:signal peptidase I